MTTTICHGRPLVFVSVLLPLVLWTRNTIAFTYHHRYTTRSTPLALPSYFRFHETRPIQTTTRVGVFRATNRALKTRIQATPTKTKASKERTTPKEVTQMFNDFADSFEDLLINSLNYTAPQQVAQKVSKRIASFRDGQRYTAALDAGCGTGLMGLYLRSSVVGPLVGVDLSPKMAELAAELVGEGDDGIVMSQAAANTTGTNSTTPSRRPRRSTETARLAQNLDRIYDGIFIADLLDISNTAKPLGDDYGHSVTTYPEPLPYFDLIASADVMCYFGKMDAILQRLAEHLKPGGDLVFSTETWGVGDYNWIMLESERYAHDAAYVGRMAVEAGLVVVSQDAINPRLESGEEVLGTLHVFHKPVV